MAYEKPELFTLSLAGTAVRGIVGGDTGSQEGSDLKAAATPESGEQHDTVQQTSSTAGAYEADE